MPFGDAVTAGMNVTFPGCETPSLPAILTGFDLAPCKIQSMVVTARKRASRKLQDSEVQGQVTMHPVPGFTVHSPSNGDYFCERAAVGKFRG